MRIFIFFLFCTVTTSSVFAQTKKIAFKSHSGNMADFKTAFNNALFDMENSNFGLPFGQLEVTESLDSVIFVSDSVTILVTQEHLNKIEVTSLNPKKSKSSMQSYTMRKEVYNDPLFSQQHSLDSIKKVLKTEKRYVNPIKKVVFVGYDNKSKHKRNSMTPFFTGNNHNNPPSDIPVIVLLSTVVLISLITGYISYKYYQLRHSQPINLPITFA